MVGEDKDKFEAGKKEVFDVEQKPFFYTRMLVYYQKSISRKSAEHTNVVSQSDLFWRNDPASPKAAEKVVYDCFKKYTRHTVAGQMSGPIFEGFCEQSVC